MNRIFAIALVVLGCGVAAVAQARPSSLLPAQTLVVLPFENISNAPGLEWIGESFPEVLGERLGAAPLYVISRNDRAYAFDRAGIPANARLSRATLFRIVEQMDADYVVLGRYNYDGQTFTASAQVLDMKRLRLSPEARESGALVKLNEVQTALAWDVLKQLWPEVAGTKESFLASASAVRLDAFENYIRGLVATSTPLKIKHFREAVRLNPNYTPALFQLGRAYFDSRDYDAALSWFAKISKDDAAAREANFYMGLAAYYMGDFDKAEHSFNFLASQLPLTEVYNNLGVVAARRGKRSALEYFQKAVQVDPSDADYHFNLAVALEKAGDPAGAARQLRTTLNLRPNDGEAKSLLDTLVAGGLGRVQGQTGNAARIPMERIKRNYDETSFQQLALEIENATERRLANTDPASHAAFHVERGREFVAQGFWAQAEKEFREAVRLAPSNAGAHAGLARVLEQAKDSAGARTEAQAALSLQPSAEALLVLARLDMEANQRESAEKNVDRALALEPGNSTALMLKRSIVEKAPQ